MKMSTEYTSLLISHIPTKQIKKGHLQIQCAVDIPFGYSEYHAQMGTLLFCFTVHIDWTFDLLISSQGRLHKHYCSLLTNLIGPFLIQTSVFMWHISTGSLLLWKKHNQK